VRLFLFGAMGFFLLVAPGSRALLARLSEMGNAQSCTGEKTRAEKKETEEAKAGVEHRGRPENRTEKANAHKTGPFQGE